MITRSQTKLATQYRQNIIYNVDIDFDEASRAWNANKRRLTNGEYVYICGKVMKNGRKCMKSQCSAAHSGSSKL
jgi:hypothetical protein